MMQTPLACGHTHRHHPPYVLIAHMDLGQYTGSSLQSLLSGMPRISPNDGPIFGVPSSTAKTSICCFTTRTPLRTQSIVMSIQHRNCGKKNMFAIVFRCFVMITHDLSVSAPRLNRAKPSFKRTSIPASIGWETNELARPHAPGSPLGVRTPRPRQPLRPRRQTETSTGDGERSQVERRRERWFNWGRVDIFIHSSKRLHLFTIHRLLVFNVVLLVTKGDREHRRLPDRSSDPFSHKGCNALEQ